MKKLIIALTICLCLFSCKKDDEPKSLTVKNGINQTRVPWFKTNMGYVERVLIIFFDSDKKTVRTENYTVAFYTVSNLTDGYQVMSAPIEDNIVSMYVLVQFYNPGFYINLEYASELIPIHDGANSYTITESNSTKN